MSTSDNIERDAKLAQGARDRRHGANAWSFIAGGRFTTADSIRQGSVTALCRQSSHLQCDKSHRNLVAWEPPRPFRQRCIQPPNQHLKRQQEMNSARPANFAGPAFANLGNLFSTEALRASALAYAGGLYAACRKMSIFRKRIDIRCHSIQQWIRSSCVKVSSVASLEHAISTHPCDEQHMPEAQVWPPLDPQVSSDAQLDCAAEVDAGAAAVLATYPTEVTDGVVE